MVVDVAPLSGPPRVGDILVFKTRTGLVAHRFVGGAVTLRDVPETASAFVTAGDAHPARREVVPAGQVVGLVAAVWSSDAPNARRVDTLHFRLLGAFFARSRRLRSFFAKACAYAPLLIGDPARIAPPPAFAALVSATREFERCRHAEGVARLCSLPQKNIINMARRHRASGLILRWLDEASQAGVAVPSDLREAFRRSTWTNSLQAGRVLARLRDVRDRFVAAGVPHIVLKGGARLASGEPGADLHFSCDLDVLVPSDMAEFAIATLRAAGYRELFGERESARFAALHHHRAALYPPAMDVPVEVHVALAPPLLVSRCLDYAALEPLSRRANGPVGEVRVLDAVASAVHLAYHARDLRVWRDIVMLSRLLRDFDGAARACFDAYVNAEKRDGLRLASAVAAADAIAFDAECGGAVKRYIAWATLREDLPERMSYATDIVEAVVGRCPMPELRLDHAAGIAPWLRAWIRNAVLLPSLGRIALWRRSHSRST
jgi:hypothetical protein